MSYFDNSEQKAAFFQTLRQFGLSLLFTSLMIGASLHLFGIDQRGKEDIYCDTEHQVMHKGFLSYEQEGHYFGGGEKQSEEQAYSGQFSAKLTKEEAFGLEFSYPYVSCNEQFRVTVWRYRSNMDYDHGLIVASIPNTFWQGDAKIIERAEGSQWEKIELTFQPNLKCCSKQLDIYCWNNGRTPVYFDDLHIEIRREENL
ncbi:MAG: hypothetical protein AAFP19_24385 [Bacteroidota bacterium]